MIEILASVLAGNPIISTVLSGGQPHMNGLALAVNISAFTDISTFAAQIRQLVRAIKGLPPTSSTDEILLPGERGFRQAQASLKDGIKLANGTTDRLRELADQFGITPPASL